MRPSCEGAVQVGQRRVGRRETDDLLCKYKRWRRTRQAGATCPAPGVPARRTLLFVTSADSALRTESQWNCREATFTWRGLRRTRLHLDSVRYQVIGPGVQDESDRRATARSESGSARRASPSHSENRGSPTRQEGGGPGADRRRVRGGADQAVLRGYGPGALHKVETLRSMQAVAMRVLNLDRRQ